MSEIGEEIKVTEILKKYFSKNIVNFLLGVIHEFFVIGYVRGSNAFKKCNKIFYRPYYSYDLSVECEDKVIYIEVKGYSLLRRLVKLLLKRVNASAKRVQKYNEKINKLLHDEFRLDSKFRKRYRLVAFVNLNNFKVVLISYEVLKRIFLILNKDNYLGHDLLQIIHFLLIKLIKLNDEEGIRKICEEFKGIISIYMGKVWRKICSKYIDKYRFIEDIEEWEE